MFGPSHCLQRSQFASSSIRVRHLLQSLATAPLVGPGSSTRRGKASLGKHAERSSRNLCLAGYIGRNRSSEGPRVLLHLMARSKEDAKTVTAFFENMKLRGLNDPLLNGAPGDLKAIEACCRRASRQPCLAHRRVIRTTNLLQRFFMEERGASDHPAHFR